MYTLNKQDTKENARLGIIMVIYNIGNCKTGLIPRSFHSFKYHELVDLRYFKPFMIVL